MRITDAQLEELRTTGWVVCPGFLTPEELAAACREGVFESGLPRPDEYFAEQQASGGAGGEKRGQFDFFANFPFGSDAINRMLLHPHLIDAAQRFLGGEVRFCKGELMGKYAGAADYEQTLHRDYGNHTLLVPRADREYTELTTFIYLSDVTVANGATALVPRTVSDERVPMGVTRPTDPEDVAALRAEEQCAAP